ncbi:MAG: AI-2E family transporter, partial [Mesorhizobium sp.]
MAKAPGRATPRTATTSRASADRAAPAPAPDYDGAIVAADDSSGGLRRQVFFWLATAVLLALFLYVFSGILL